MGRDIELACDERIIRGLDAAERKKYSLALLKSSEYQTAHCPLAFGEIGVKERVKRLGYKKPGRALLLAAAYIYPDL